jgi:hypothetical protein
MSSVKTYGTFSCTPSSSNFARVSETNSSLVKTIIEDPKKNIYFLKPIYHSNKIMLFKINPKGEVFMYLTLGELARYFLCAKPFQKTIKPAVLKAINYFLLELPALSDEVFVKINPKNATVLFGEIVPLVCNDNHLAIDCDYHRYEYTWFYMTSPLSFEFETITDIHSIYHTVNISPDTEKSQWHINKSQKRAVPQKGASETIISSVSYFVSASVHSDTINSADKIFSRLLSTSDEATPRSDIHTKGMGV